MTLGMLEILRGGGFTTGGLNFDSKLRRQSIDRNDLFYAHIGGMDTMARALLAAASIVESGDLDASRRPLRRLVGRTGHVDQRRRDARRPARAGDDTGEPTRASGHQEQLENLVARHIERAR